MDMTVEKLKLGTKIKFGAYTTTDGLFAPSSICWLKASPEGDFIAESVLDYIAFDARERRSPDIDHRYYGNPSYELSNILQFLNSEEQSWFTKTHDADEKPDQGNCCGYTIQYGGHPGFLYPFTEYEIASMQGMVELPHLSQVFGDGAFPLFKKKGIRPKATEDLISRKLGRDGFGYNSYVDFWTQDLSGSGSVRTVGRDGYSSNKKPYENCGLRPVVRLKPETKLVIDVDGIFTLEPFTVEDSTPVFSDEDLLKYLGLNPA